MQSKVQVASEQGTASEWVYAEAFISGALGCLEPNRIDALLKKANILFGQESYKELLKCCNSILDLDTRCVSAWIFRGAALYELGNTVEAINSYKKVLEIDPKNLSATTNIGVIYWKQKNGVKARLWLKLAYEICPNANSARNMALLCEKEGDYAAALKYFVEASKKGPDEDSDGHISELGVKLGKTIQENKDLKRAIQQSQKEVEALKATVQKLQSELAEKIPQPTAISSSTSAKSSFEFWKKIQSVASESKDDVNNAKSSTTRPGNSGGKTRE